MKKIKTFLAFALAVSMCISTAACGNADESEKNDTEKEVTTSAAESVAEETNSEAAQAESVAETEAVTTENTDESSVAEEAETSEVEPEQSAEGISFTELEPYISEIAGKDIDTAEGILKDALNLTSARAEDGPYMDNWMYYGWELPENFTISGIHFDSVSITTIDNVVDSFGVNIKYENEEIATENLIKIKQDLFYAQGYNKIDNDDIKEDSTLSKYEGYYKLNCGYASVDRASTDNKMIIISISDLH